jgi:hypothetical protein
MVSYHTGKETQRKTQRDLGTKEVQKGVEGKETEQHGVRAMARDCERWKAF